MTGEALLQDPDWQRTVQEVDKAGDGKVSSPSYQYSNVFE